MSTVPPTPTVAAVLPGGGARGAYEAGALSVLLPALEARGERVSIWCGTSVGAIDATAMASLAHLLLRLGARDARRWLRRHPRFWCRDATHDLSFARL